MLQLRKVSHRIELRRLAAWLYRITRNVITDYYRQANLTPESFDEIDQAKRPDEENLNELVAEWIKNRISQLPDIYQEAVFLSELEVSLKLK